MTLKKCLQISFVSHPQSRLVNPQRVTLSKKFKNNINCQIHLSVVSSNSSAAVVVVLVLGLSEEVVVVVVVVAVVVDVVVVISAFT